MEKGCTFLGQTNKRPAEHLYRLTRYTDHLNRYINFSHSPQHGARDAGNDSQDHVEFHRCTMAGFHGVGELFRELDAMVQLLPRGLQEDTCSLRVSIVQTVAEGVVKSPC